MVITTGELEEGAHHVSAELYKAICLVLLDNKAFPHVIRPTPREADGALPSVEEIVCPVCSGMVRLYEGNKIGIHTPHGNVQENICKMSGVAIQPRR